MMTLRTSMYEYEYEYDYVFPCFCNCVVEMTTRTTLKSASKSLVIE